LNNEVYKNDDYQPTGTGNYSSGLCIYSENKKTATIIVTNLSNQFGSQMSYDLGVNEAPELEINPTNLEFGPVIQGGDDPAFRRIEIDNSTNAGLNWTAETDTEWLSVSPLSGVTPDDLTVSVDMDGLTSGNYEATIVISGTDLCTRNTPQIVTVNLEVSSSAMNSTRRSAGVSLLAPDVLNQFGNSSWDQPIFNQETFAMVQNQKTTEKAVEFIIILDLKAISL
jgi:hypothetical protein